MGRLQIVKMGILATPLLWLVEPTAALAVDTIDLSPKVAAGDVAQVVIELEVGGDLKVRDQAEAKQPTEQEAVKTVPMSVHGEVEYDERLLTGSNGEIPRRAARHYRLAEVVLKIDNGGETRKLPENLRLVLVDASQGRPLIVSPAGPLDRDELDLIDLVGNTTVLDRLLPGKSVADGETWPMEAATALQLLGLDSVALCEVQSVLDEVNSGFARIRFTGPVNGAVDGAATELSLQGIYLFDRKLGRITQFNLAIQEERSISPASPGLAAVAKLRVKLTPIEAPAELSDAVVAQFPEGIPAELQQLKLRDENLGFQVNHDRQWFITGDRREQKSLRRIDADGLVAHCTMTKLPPQSIERQTTLEQFASDIQFALGKSFREIAASEQWTNQHGERCMSAVGLGQVDGVPVQWRYYLLTPEEEGPRLSVVITVEQAAVDRLGKADRELVHRIDLLPDSSTKPAATAQREMLRSVLKKQ